MINFENTYSELDSKFFSRVEPSKVPNPKLIKFNFELAKDLGIPNLETKIIEEYFSGNKIFASSKPLAQVYAGHQFGHFVTQLGDGRAILLGELIDQKSIRRDIQLKGSGRTPYSRSGDGKAALGPVLREYLVSEAMYHLGVPTTRSLAALKTGEYVYRDQELQGAILTRVASSHIRVGTFEYFFAKGDNQAIKELADYSISRHYPEIQSKENPYLSFFEEVVKKQAELTASWMSIGFVHGVMNTDNTTISAETIDYGPCAFMDFYDPNTVFSSIDHYGRYSYKNQPSIALWNMSRLANSLLFLFDEDEEKSIEKAKLILKDFETEYLLNSQKKFFKKIGIEKIQESDISLLHDFINLLHKYRADFTLSFRYLSKLFDHNEAKIFYELFDQPLAKDLNNWVNRWKKMVENDSNIITKLESTNPTLIPRNHYVERAIAEAYQGNYDYFENLLNALKTPYEANEDFIGPPRNKENHYVTFCGT